MPDAPDFGAVNAFDDGSYAAAESDLLDRGDFTGTIKPVSDPNFVDEQKSASDFDVPSRGGDQESSTSNAPEERPFAEGPTFEGFKSFKDLENSAGVPKVR